MKVTQRWLVRAGVLVIALTNAVALIGVTYNRKSPPDSVLALSEREVGLQWNWMWRVGENSGLSLRLELRTEGVSNSQLAQDGMWDSFSPWAGSGAVRWLDRDKLASLGFDVNKAPTADDSRYDRMLRRDVLLVLELDGPVRARALQGARDRVARLEQEAVGKVEDSQRRLQNARENLRDEEQDRSRLFIIDAGLDQASLRRQYPDRSHYAIVHGTVQPFVLFGQPSVTVYGTVAAVSCESIHVPLQFRTEVSAPAQANVWVPTSLSRADKKKRYGMQVAFGRRLEPWIVSAHAATQ